MGSDRWIENLYDIRSEREISQNNNWRKRSEKTVFRARYEQFEYLVTPFELTEAPDCFQTSNEHYL